MVRDNPEINKRVADMTAIGRAGVLDDVGCLPVLLSARRVSDRARQGWRERILHSARFYAVTPTITKMPTK